MSLIQPDPQLRQTLEQGTSMDTLVLTKLNDIQVSVNNVQNQAALLNTKLFGDATSENDGGRLPRVEFLAATNASVVSELRDKYAREVIRNGPERIEALEKGQVKFGAVVAIISAVSSMGLATLLHFLFKF